jgi:hypothetical protein
MYGNDAAEAMYPMTKALADGTPLDGSKHRYTLTFAKNQYPPVNAFWSVTMYDGKTQLLIKNPVDRYLINSNTRPALSVRRTKPCPGSALLRMTSSRFGWLSRRPAMGPLGFRGSCRRT